MRINVLGLAHFGIRRYVNNGLVYIEANRFELNRHSVASRGSAFTDYVAMYNVLEQEGPSHHFDVHGGEDREDGTHIAGRNIVIAYNTDYGSDEATVDIRGNPVNGAWVIGNQFRGDRDDIKQTKVPKSCRSVFGCPLGPGGPGGYWTSLCTSFPQGLTVQDNIFHYSDPVPPSGPGGRVPVPVGSRGRKVIRFNRSELARAVPDASEELILLRRRVSQVLTKSSLGAPPGPLSACRSCAGFC